MVALVLRLLFVFYHCLYYIEIVLIATCFFFFLGTPFSLGMVRSAMWILAEVAPALLKLQAAGYQKITVTGHSLGAGVAAFLTYMLQDRLQNVEAVLYACPSCCDAVTADSLLTR